MSDLWRLVADDDEAFYELGLYESHADAVADLAAVEAAYPGRPYWVTFRIDGLTVSPSRRTSEELAHALIALADLSEVERVWTDPNAPESWQSEHGEPRSIG